MDVGSALQAACCAESRCMFILASTEAVHWVVATVFPCKQSSVQHALAKSAQAYVYGRRLVPITCCSAALRSSIAVFVSCEMRFALEIAQQCPCGAWATTVATLLVRMLLSQFCNILDAGSS